MSWQSILLQPIHPNIVNRLDSRSVGHGRKPWVRVKSNAVIDGNTSLRDQFTLSGPYGTTGNSSLPGSGISSIVINQKGMLGGIREAQISFRVFDLSEMEIIEKLFMVPGISVVLEWGWEGFQPPPVDIRAASSMEEAQRIILKRTLGARTDEELFVNKRTNNDTYSGHYDGMIGIISNFTKDSTDRGFECSVKLVSPNGILSGHPINSQKYNVVMHRTLKNTTSTDGESAVFKTEGQPLTDMEAVLYSIKYPGSAKGQDVRLVSAPTVASLDSVGATQNQEVYEFKFEGAFDKLVSKVPVDLTGNVRPWRDYSSVDRELEFSLDIGVFKATENYDGPVIGQDILIEDQFNKVNMAYTFPVRYQNVASGFSELDQLTIQSYVSWRFIEDVLASQVLMDHYSDSPSVTVASVDITDTTPDPRFFGQCVSRTIRNLPELRSADPTICLLPGQIYGEDLEREMEFLMSPDYRGDFNASREIFGFPIESFNQPPMFSTDGTKTRGYLRNIMVNVDFILETYKPDTNQTITEFLEALLQGISKSCGDFWSFHVVANPNRPQVLEVVDEKTVGEKSVNHYKFRLNTFDTKVKNFGVSTKLPQKVQSLAYLGARSTDVPEKENSIHLSDSSAFLGYSRGVKDFFNIRSKKASLPPTLTNVPGLNQTPITPVSQEDDEVDNLTEEERAEYLSDRAEEDLFNNLPPRERWLNSYANLLYRNFATPEARESGEEALKNYLVQDNEREAYIDEEKSPSFLIPVELTMTLDGISGVYMGNAFLVNTYLEGGPLPDRYRGKVAYQVTDVVHKIGESWETDITGMMRMLDIRMNPRSGPKPKRQAFQGRSTSFTPSLFEGPVDGLSGPSGALTSDSSLDALHPGLRPRVELILDKLRVKGWDPAVVTVYRSLSDQLRKLEDGFSTVTFGPHNNVIGTQDNPQRASLALDIVDRRYLWAEGKPLEDQQKAAEFFLDLGKAFKDDGWKWGGDWQGLPSVWNNYLRYDYEDNLGFGYDKGRYNQDGWPIEYRMGWDPAHVEIFKRPVSNTFSRKYEGLPTKAEARQISAKIYGRTL